MRRGESTGGIRLRIHMYIYFCTVVDKKYSTEYLDKSSLSILLTLVFRFLQIDLTAAEINDRLSEQCSSNLHHFEPNFMIRS